MCVSPNTQYGVISPTEAMIRESWTLAVMRSGRTRWSGKARVLTAPCIFNPRPQRIGTEEDLEMSWLSEFTRSRLPLSNPAAVWRIGGSLQLSSVLIRGRIGPVLLQSWRGYLRSGPTVVTPCMAELDARKVEAIGQARCQGPPMSTLPVHGTRECLQTSRSS